MCVKTMQRMGDTVWEQMMHFHFYLNSYNIELSSKGMKIENWDMNNTVCESFSLCVCDKKVTLKESFKIIVSEKCNWPTMPTFFHIYKNGV